MSKTLSFTLPLIFLFQTSLARAVEPSKSFELTEELDALSELTAKITAAHIPPAP